MSITDSIGKILYPRRQPWERRRNVKWLFIVAFIALIIIAIVGLVLVMKGSAQYNPDMQLQ